MTGQFSGFITMPSGSIDVAILMALTCRAMESAFDSPPTESRATAAIYARVSTSDQHCENQLVELR
jgi:predicted site-specific integrase-resolvase